jgi:hypothetical protein
VWTPRRECAAQLGESGDSGEYTDTRDAAAHERTREDLADRRRHGREEVALPEPGPRRDDQDESRFEEVRGEEEAGEERNDQPPVCTRARRSARAATSR